MGPSNVSSSQVEAVSPSSPEQKTRITRSHQRTSSWSSGIANFMRKSIANVTNVMATSKSKVGIQNEGSGGHEQSLSMAPSNVANVYLDGVASDPGKPAQERTATNAGSLTFK